MALAVLTYHAVTDRGDHPGTGPLVCDGLMQMHMAMKHPYIGQSWRLQVYLLQVLHLFL